MKDFDFESLIRNFFFVFDYWKIGIFLNGIFSLNQPYQIGYNAGRILKNKQVKFSLIKWIRWFFKIRFNSGRISFHF